MPLSSVGNSIAFCYTAADRPHTDTLPPVCDPTADHGDEELKHRREDVELKHDQIRKFLDESGHDAVVLGLSRFRGLVHVWR